MKFSVFLIFALIAAAFAAPRGSGSNLVGVLTGIVAGAGGAVVGKSKLCHNS